jgi:hypothetical protein
MIDKIKQVSKLIDEAEVIFNSTATWEVKYSLIFAMEIWKQINEAGYDFDWYDPDTSYEEDVTYYFHALKDFQNNLGDLVEVQNARF